MLRSLDREVQLFWARPLADIYQYLFLDGICLRVKGAVERQKRMVLCAYGIRLDGKREIISFRQATDESEAKWEAFLTDLYDRGLVGRKLKMVVTDGCQGLHRALDTVYPYVSRQRCWAHKLRNVANKVRRADQKECNKQASLIYQAENKREAVKRYREWEAKWRHRYPDAAEMLGEGSGRATHLSGHDCRAQGQSAYHQRHRAILSRSTATHPPHESLQQHSQREPYQLRRHKSSE